MSNFRRRLMMNIKSKDEIVNILTNNLTAGETGTKVGVQYTVNEDLSITLKGTTTKTFGLRLAGKWANTNTVLTLEPGDYTLSGKVGNFFVSSYLKTTPGVSPIAFRNTNLKSPTKFTIKETVELGDIFIYCNKIGSQVDGTIYPMLLKGTYTAETLPEYKPYIQK